MSANCPAIFNLPAQRIHPQFSLHKSPFALFSPSEKFYSHSYWADKIKIVRRLNIPDLFHHFICKHCSAQRIANSRTEHYIAKKGYKEYQSN